LLVTSGLESYWTNKMVDVRHSDSLRIRRSCVRIPPGFLSYRCLFIRLYVYTSIRLYVYTFIHLYVYTSIRLYVYTSIRLYVYTFIRLYVYMFYTLYVCLCIAKLLLVATCYAFS
jgi:hypothetical protein